MNRILCVTIFFFICFTHFGQGREMTILQLENNRFKAMIRKDSNYLVKILANDLVYIHSNGRQDTKESFIQSIMNGRMEYISIDVSQANIRSHSQTAWVHGAAKIKVRAGKENPPIDLSIKYLDVYKREDGEWKLVAWQSARID